MPWHDALDFIIFSRPLQVLIELCHQNLVLLYDGVTGWAPVMPTAISEFCA